MLGSVLKRVDVRDTSPNAPARDTRFTVSLVPLAGAFALEQESAATCERYGNNIHSQSVLLARRLVKVSDTGQIVYQAEKQACRAFPDPKGDGIRAGVNRNFKILPPLHFLAEFTPHIPPKGSHLIRYYGWYSNKSRGMRKKNERLYFQIPST